MTPAYTWQMLTAMGGGRDTEFQVIAAMELPSDFVYLHLTPSIEAGDIIELTCCEEDASLVHGASLDGCVAPNCVPHCIPLAYEALPYVRVTMHYDYESALADQIEILPFVDPAAGYFDPESWQEYDPALTELCTQVDIFSWLDLTTQTHTECIPNPMPSLVPIRETPSAFGSIRECVLPPEGLSAAWCASEAYACEIAPLEQEEARFTESIKLCAHYYAICDRPEPEVPLAFAAGNSGGSPGLLNDDGATIPKENASRGCSIPRALRQKASSNAGFSAASAMVALLLAARRRRCG